MILALILMSIFMALSLLHFYWLFGGRVGIVVVIPELNGKPLFRPSALATVIVAIILGVFALIVGATAELFLLGLSHELLVWFSRAMALVLLLRAIGDFHYMGFFKRIRNTRFATMDTLIYSPLCLVLAVGVVTISVY